MVNGYKHCSHMTAAILAASSDVEGAILSPGCSFPSTITPFLSASLQTDNISIDPSIIVKGALPLIKNPLECPPKGDQGNNSSLMVLRMVKGNVF
jgi:hypothetical protein